RLEICFCCLLSFHSLPCLLFFFSSRRRHTRCYRDWSSDVCSSDLQVGEVAMLDLPDVTPVADVVPFPIKAVGGDAQVEIFRQERSEERRVGKEWRSRLRAEDHKKKWKKLWEIVQM